MHHDLVGNTGAALDLFNKELILILNNTDASENAVVNDDNLNWRLISILRLTLAGMSLLS